MTRLPTRNPRRAGLRRSTFNLAVGTHTNRSGLWLHRLAVCCSFLLFFWLTHLFAIASTFLLPQRVPLKLKRFKRGEVKFRQFLAECRTTQPLHRSRFKESVTHAAVPRCDGTSAGPVQARLVGIVYNTSPELNSTPLIVCWACHCLRFAWVPLSAMTGTTPCSGPAIRKRGRFIDTPVEVDQAHRTRQLAPRALEIPKLQPLHLF